MLYAYIMASSPAAEPVVRPPLESGDRLNAPEFRRRYELRPDVHRAELIEGVVFVPSPMRYRAHSRPVSIIFRWLAAYEDTRDDVEVAEGPTVRLDLDNEVQPDVMMRRVTGSSRETDDDYLEGPPELMVEVAASSVSVDMGTKKQAYRRNGVREYIVWQIFENRLTWFRLDGGEFAELLAGPDGVIESIEFPGLRLAVDRLLARDSKGVLAEQNRKSRKAR